MTGYSSWFFDIIISQPLFSINITLTAICDDMIKSRGRDFYIF